MDHAATPPNAVDASGKTGGLVNAAEPSVPAQFHQQTLPSQLLGSRLFPDTMPAESRRRGPEKNSAHPAGRQPRQSADASQVMPEAVFNESFPAVHAASANAAARKAAAPGKPLDGMLSHDGGPSPLQRSPAAEAANKNDSTRSAAQPQPDPVQASVLPLTPFAGRHAGAAAKAVRRPSTERFKAPGVRIGQVDVFIEAPQRSVKSRPSSPPASLSLASRNYLRRL